MHFTRRTAVSTALSAIALSLALGALPGAAHAAPSGPQAPTGGQPSTEVSSQTGAQSPIGAQPLSRKGYWPLESAPGGVSANVQQGGLPLTLNGDSRIYRTDDVFAPPPLVDQGDLRLDGAGDWAETSAPPVTGDGSFTLAARARLDAADGRTQTVLSLPGAHADRIAIRYRAASGKWEVAVATEDRAGAPRVVVTEEQALPDDYPSSLGDHLAVVYDAPNSELRLYVNGALSTTSTAVDATSWPATGGLQVGRSATAPTGEHFAGTIDEVRAYTGVADHTSIRMMAALTGLVDL